VRTFLSFDSPLQFRPFRSLLRSQQHCDLDVAPFAVPTQRLGGNSLTPGSHLSAATSSRLIACHYPNSASPLARDFSRFYGERCKKTEFQDVNWPIAGSAFGRSSTATHPVGTFCAPATLESLPLSELTSFTEAAMENARTPSKHRQFDGGLTAAGRSARGDP
jgi:hypothetical protein